MSLLSAGTILIIIKVFGIKPWRAIKTYICYHREAVYWSRYTYLEVFKGQCYILTSSLLLMIFGTQMATKKMKYFTIVNVIGLPKPFVTPIVLL